MRQADDRVRAGDLMEIGGQEGRRVDQTEPRHAEHAVSEVAHVVAPQIVPDELFIGRLAGDQVVIGGHQLGAALAHAARRCATRPSTGGGGGRTPPPVPAPRRRSNGRLCLELSLSHLVHHLQHHLLDGLSQHAGPVQQLGERTLYRLYF